MLVMMNFKKESDVSGSSSPISTSADNRAQPDGNDDTSMSGAVPFDDGSSITSDEQALTVIDEPQPEDILCGKDKSFRKHRGNLLFRDMVASYLPAYHKARSKSEKMKLTKEVVYRMQIAYQSRFLKPMIPGAKKSDQQWQPISDLQARDKVSHALRFAAKGTNSVAEAKKQAPSSASARLPPVTSLTIMNTSALTGSLTSLTASLKVDLNEETFPAQLNSVMDIKNNNANDRQPSRRLTQQEPDSLQRAGKPSRMFYSVAAAEPERSFFSLSTQQVDNTQSLPPATVASSWINETSINRPYQNRSPMRAASVSSMESDRSCFSAPASLTGPLRPQSPQPCTTNDKVTQGESRALHEDEEFNRSCSLESMFLRWNVEEEDLEASAAEDRKIALSTQAPAPLSIHQHGASFTSSSAWSETRAMMPAGDGTTLGVPRPSPHQHVATAARFQTSREAATGIAPQKSNDAHAKDPYADFLRTL